MPFLLYDYLDEQGENVIKKWIDDLQVKERSKLEQKLDSLIKNGDALLPDTLSPTKKPGILKLRVHGGVQLRPLLCRGPVNPTTEYTLLSGAKEVGSKFVPRGVLELAESRKAIVQNNPLERRILNEQNA